MRGSLGVMFIIVNLLEGEITLGDTDREEGGKTEGETKRKGERKDLMRKVANQQRPQSDILTIKILIGKAHVFFKDEP